jgi:hypothetical protein
MYNRILKRPMFKRGGPSYQSQGTGITSPYDVPRGGYYGGGTIGGGIIHGNPMGNRTGFEEPELRPEAEIQADILEVGKAPEGTWWDDVIGSFSAYSKPYKDDGTAKTIGEMGAEQAEEITAIRKARKDKEDLAKLTGYERELALRDKQSERSHEFNKLAKGFEYDTFLKQLDQEGTMALAKYQGDVQIKIAELAKQNTATGISLQSNDEILAEELEAANDIVHPAEKAAAVRAAREGHKARKLEIITKTNIKAEARKIAAAMAGDPMKSAEDIITDVLIIIKGLEQALAKGGRVGYQMGTPQTGAMPMQPIQASLTETIDTPTADITETETVTEGQQSSVQMPYQEFRAAIPAEVSDEIVQLIYYNQDAFADFSQITTQSDVYAFNNKYGVSLVLPMDTETT